MTTKRGPGTIRQYEEELKALQAELTDVTIKKATVKEVKKIICRWFTLSVRIAMAEQGWSPSDIRDSAAYIIDGMGYDDAINNVLYGRGGTSIEPAVAIAQAINRSLGELLPPINPKSEKDRRRAEDTRDDLHDNKTNYTVNSFASYRIQQEKTYRKLTIDALASKSGLGRATVSAIRPKTGVAIRLTTLWLIAKALCVPVDYLLPSLSQLSKLLNNP